MSTRSAMRSPRRSRMARRRPRGSSNVTWPGKFPRRCASPTTESAHRRFGGVGRDDRPSAATAACLRSHVRARRISWAECSRATIFGRRHSDDAFGLLPSNDVASRARQQQCFIMTATDQSYTLTTGATSTLTVTFNPVRNRNSPRCDSKPAAGFAVRALIDDVVRRQRRCRRSRRARSRCLRTADDDAIATRTVDVGSLTDSWPLIAAAGTLFTTARRNVTSCAGHGHGCGRRCRPTGGVTFPAPRNPRRHDTIRFQPDRTGTYTVVADSAGGYELCIGHKFADHVTIGPGPRRPSH